jgi:oligopeptide transport system ATP-binding protein
MVMYLGEIVEEAPSEELFKNPLHPYTRALLSAVPDVAKGLASRNKKSERVVLQGEVPSRIDEIVGCPFASRCPQAAEKCRVERPQPSAFGNSHTAACHFAGVWACKGL